MFSGSIDEELRVKSGEVSTTNGIERGYASTYVRLTKKGDAHDESVHLPTCISIVVEARSMNGLGHLTGDESAGAMFDPSELAVNVRPHLRKGFGVPVERR